MVEVSNKHKNITVGVSSNNGNTIVTAKSDTSQYWANQSHTFADQAKESAQEAKNYAELANSYIEGFENVVTNNTNNIIETGNDYINQLNTTKEEVTEEINATVANGKDEINSTKTTVINDIEFVADGEKKEIEDLIDNGKDELKEAIGDVKVLTTLKIGQIGIAPLGIDETLNMERYLNGQIIIQDQFKGFTNYLKRRVELYPSIACLEDEWQAIVANSDFSQCGKFVIDDNAGTIRLPKIIMPIQGLTDLSKLGEIIEAGLPNITGTMVANIYETFYVAGTGAFKTTAAAKGKAGQGSSPLSTSDIDFKASLSNPIYGNSDTVQQEQIQYPYFIQVATGAETEDNIINEIELNNPFSLLDVKWSDKLLNNISWLRSEGQANSKAIYNDIYELILKEYNSGTDEIETVGGINITFRRGSETNIKVTINKSAYDSILSATGTAWYYVIDMANETFYLPQSDGFLQFGGNGEFVEAGLPNITGTFTGGDNSAGDRYATGAFKHTGTNAPEKLGGGSYSRGVITFDASTSNPIYGNSDTVQPNAIKGYLYFYVGETVQNANLINAGRIEETLVTKTDKTQAAAASMPSSKYIDLILGASDTTYIAPANGWFYALAKTSAVNGYVQLYNGNINLHTISQYSSANAFVAVYLPSSKGDVFNFIYVNCKEIMFRFVYAEGEV